MDSNVAFSAPKEKARAILVVDDDTQVLKFLTRMLGAMGYDPVYQASSAQEAVEIFKLHERHIGLVVSDFVMPEISGDRLALRLRNDKPHLNILLISGNEAESLQSAIPLEVGRNFLQKPFTIADIQKTVDRLINPSGAEPVPA
jgi:two-component system cell cycle sensor histidine kinase/response regulator CckA